MSNNNIDMNQEYDWEDEVENTSSMSDIPDIIEYEMMPGMTHGKRSMCQNAGGFATRSHRLLTMVQKPVIFSMSEYLICISQ